MQHLTWYTKYNDYTDDEMNNHLAASNGPWSDAGTCGGMFLDNFAFGLLYPWVCPLGTRCSRPGWSSRLQ